MRNYYNFYIIALNDDGPRIVNINGDQLNEKDTKMFTNIAYIDKLTTNYEEGVMRRYLYDKKIISSLDTPIFIVRSYKLNDKYNIKYYNVLFKKGETDLVENLATTILRERELRLSDAYYLMERFKEEYKGNKDFHDIADHILNEHDIKHIINYLYCFYDEKKTPIKYVLLRDVVSVFYEYNKYKKVDKYLSDVCRCYESEDAILSILPNKIKVKRSDLSEIKVLSQEDISEIKHDKWDNAIAQKEHYNKKMSNKSIATLTLEDELRSGKIDAVKYKDIREKQERKFRK